MKIKTRVLQLVTAYIRGAHFNPCMGTRPMLKYHACMPHIIAHTCTYQHVPIYAHGALAIAWVIKSSH